MLLLGFERIQENYLGQKTKSPLHLKHPFWQHDRCSWVQVLVALQSGSVQDSIQSIIMNHRNQFSKVSFVTDASAGIGSFLHFSADIKAFHVTEFSTFWSWAWSMNISISILLNTASLSVAKLEACKLVVCCCDLPVSPLLWGSSPSGCNLLLDGRALPGSLSSSCARSWACKQENVYNLT